MFVVRLLLNARVQYVEGMGFIVASGVNKGTTARGKCITFIHVLREIEAVGK